jgi:tetratricopeptide (TPR) repeat protein
MMPSMRAPLALLVLLAASCSLSQEELDLIADYRQRAAQYYDVNDLNRAEQQARRGLEIDPEDGELRHILGRTLLKKGDPTSVQMAGLELEEAHAVTADFKTAYSLGEYHLRHAELLLGSAVILEQKRAELEGDSREDEARANMLADIQDRRTRAEDHLTRALGLIDDALAGRPEWVEALQHRASILAHQHRDDESLVAIGKLCEILQDSRRYKNNTLATQQMTVANENFVRESLMRDMAWEIEARGLAAGILMNGQRWREAEDELTEILKLAPERANEYYNRGLARYFRGSLADAAADMRLFLGKTKLAEDAAQVQRALEILDEFEKDRRRVDG